MNEIEVKAKVANLSLLKDKLGKLGIKLSHPITQRDRIFFPKDLVGQFTDMKRRGKRTKAPALRIREQGKKIIFTYKIPVSNNLDKLEFESGIDNPEAMTSICEQLGFVLHVRVNKIRRKASFNGYEICLDEFEDLGSFIEVEKMSDKPADMIQKELWEFLKTLGIKEEDRQLYGYDILLEMKKANS